MTLNRDYFALRLIKENATYLVGFFILLGVLIFSIIFFASQYEKTSSGITQGKNELEKLKAKTNFINYRNDLANQGVDIDSMNLIFNALVPDTEDFFSIVVALERLSIQTNFNITSYVINLNATTKEKLSLTISGQGDSESFLEFLKDYNFAGGRLITVDKISFSRESLAGTELQANFYNKKVNLSETAEAKPMTSADKALLTSIKSKIIFDVKSQQPVDINYETKSNPF